MCCVWGRLKLQYSTCSAKWGTFSDGEHSRGEQTCARAGGEAPREAARLAAARSSSPKLRRTVWPMRRAQIDACGQERGRSVPHKHSSVCALVHCHWHVHRTEQNGTERNARIRCAHARHGGCVARPLSYECCSTVVYKYCTVMRAHRSVRRAAARGGRAGGRAPLAEEHELHCGRARGHMHMSTVR